MESNTLDFTTYIKAGYINLDSKYTILGKFIKLKDLIAEYAKNAPLTKTAKILATNNELIYVRDLLLLSYDSFSDYITGFTSPRFGYEPEFLVFSEYSLFADSGKIISGSIPKEARVLEPVIADILFENHFMPVSFKVSYYDLDEHTFYIHSKYYYKLGLEEEEIPF